MTDKMKIRRFKESDASGISTLIRRCWHEMDLGDYQAEGIQIQIDGTKEDRLTELSNRGTFFVAERENAILAFGGHDTESVRLMFVSPDFQRQGTGTLLLRTILKDARDRGLEKLECNSTVYAVPFYKKNGFIENGELKFKHIHFKRMWIDLKEWSEK